MVENLVGFPVFGDYGQPHPQSSIIDAVARDSMSWPARLISRTVALTAIGIAFGACKSKSPEPPGGSAGPTASRQFSGDAKVAAEGRDLFLKFNCYGCHGGLGGGGMGPSLRDTTWRYGSTDAAIRSSIHDGRFMGMPAYSSILNADQISTLAVYIRSLRTAAESKSFGPGISGEVP